MHTWAGAMPNNYRVYADSNNKINHTPGKCCDVGVWSVRASRSVYASCSNAESIGCTRRKSTDWVAPLGWVWNRYVGVARVPPVADHEATNSVSTITERFTPGEGYKVTASFWICRSAWLWDRAYRIVNTQALIIRLRWVKASLAFQLTAYFKVECSLLTATSGGVDNTGIPPTFTVSQLTTIYTKLQHSGTIAVWLHSNVRASADFSPVGKKPFNSRVRRCVTWDAVHTYRAAPIVPCGHIQIVAIDSKARNKRPIIYNIKFKHKWILLLHTVGLTLTCSCYSGEVDTPWSIPCCCICKYTDSVGSSRLQSTNDKGPSVVVCDVHCRLLPSSSPDKELEALDDSVAQVCSWQPPQHLDGSFIDGLNVKLWRGSIRCCLWVPFSTVVNYIPVHRFLHREEQC